MTQRIAVFNRSTAPLGFDMAAFTAALNEYVSSAVAPSWNVSASLHVADGPVKGEWGLVFLDNVDTAEAGILAYHDEETGAPLAKVFVDTIRQAGCSTTVAASHELVEMLADPLCVCYATSSDPQTLYALEPADATEDDSLAFEVQGFKMSNFCYPAWFDVTAASRPGTKFDHLGVITRPFEIHSGGYAITLKGGAYDQIFGSTSKAAAFAKEDRRGHRSEVRAARARRAV